MVWYPVFQYPFSYVYSISTPYWDPNFVWTRCLNTSIPNYSFFSPKFNHYYYIYSLFMLCNMSLKYSPCISSFRSSYCPITRSTSVLILNVLVIVSHFNLCRLPISGQEPTRRIPILKCWLIVYPLILRWMNQLHFNYPRLIVLSLLVKY